jgi:hypothetical protein
MIGAGLGGYASFTLGLFALNQVFTIFLYRRRKSLLWPYLPTSWLFLVGYPQNMPILFLEALGFWNPLFVVLAFLTKLPVGAPLSIWQFVWASPTSLRDPSNIRPYLFLILWGAAPLIWRKYRRKLKEILGRSSLSRSAF